MRTSREAPAAEPQKKSKTRTPVSLRVQESQVSLTVGTKLVLGITTPLCESNLGFS